MITDMLALLRDEFAQELTATRDTLVKWQAEPFQPPDGVEDMLILLERFTQAVDMVGLTGLSAYLSEIEAFTQKLVQDWLRPSKDLATWHSAAQEPWERSKNG